MRHLVRFGRTAARAALIISAAASLTLVGAAQQANAPADTINRVKAQFAPDTRLAVFDVKSETKGNAIELSGEVDQAAAKDALFKALHEAGYPNLVDKVVVLPDPEVAPRPYGIVTVSVAVMKTKPSHSSELANQLLTGMVVKVLKKDGWYYVQSQDDRYLGWMESDHLAMVTRQQLDDYQHASRVIVVAPYAWLREQPGADGAPMADLVIGDVLQTTGRNGDWVAVRLPDGRQGQVSAADVTDYEAWKAARKVTPENTERTARQFLGVPYIWGGTSIKGFDCSGFVKTVFRLNGLELQRDADQQSNQGEAVPTESNLAQLRKGDVLFFGPRPGVTRITHTGIYLGDKRFIHCAGLVKINSFDPASPTYSENLLKRLVKVRRMSSPGA